jgi:predicted transcriptional regulator of viral defense system
MTTRIARDFLRQRIFTTAEVKERYRLDDHAAWQAILYAKKQWQVGTVRRGLHYVVPPGEPAAFYRPDPFLVAAKAEPAGAIAYHAALELHGVAHSAFHEVAVACREWRRGFAVGDVRIRFVEARWGWGFKTLTREGVELRVTDGERTLIDVCDRPAYAGGLEEILRSVEGFPSVRHGRISDYVSQYRRRSLAAKVGWVLSLFEDQWGFPENHKETLRALRPPGSVTFERATRYVRDSEWGVLIPPKYESLLFDLRISAAQRAVGSGRR